MKEDLQAGSPKVNSEDGRQLRASLGGNKTGRPLSTPTIGEQAFNVQCVSRARFEQVVRPGRKNHSRTSMMDSCGH